MQSPPAFFDGVAPEALEAALAGFESRRFPAGAIILAEGDYREEMYVLREGSAHVVLVDRKGVEHVVGTVRTGEAIGEMSLLTQSPASATVRAAEDVELLVLQGPELDALLDSSPELQRNVIATLSARLARVTRLSLHERPGRVIVLEDAGAPELLGPAVAASVAWHTRSPTLYVAGVLPPVVHGTDLHVDGGVANNLPDDVMRARGQGPVIAVDVGPSVDLSIDARYSSYPPAWKVLAHGLNPFGKKVCVPTLFHILFRTAGLSSHAATERARAECTLYLKPSTGGYNFLDFSPVKEIAEVGYQSTKQRIAEWKASLAV